VPAAVGRTPRYSADRAARHPNTDVPSPASFVVVIVDVVDVVTNLAGPGAAAVFGVVALEQQRRTRCAMLPCTRTRRDLAEAQSVDAAACAVSYNSNMAT